MKLYVRQRATTRDIPDTWFDVCSRLHASWHRCISFLTYCFCVCTRLICIQAYIVVYVPTLSFCLPFPFTVPVWVVSPRMRFPTSPPTSFAVPIFLSPPGFSALNTVPPCTLSSVYFLLSVIIYLFCWIHFGVRAFRITTCLLFHKKTYMYIWVIDFSKPISFSVFCFYCSYGCDPTGWLCRWWSHWVVFSVGLRGALVGRNPTLRKINMLYALYVL